MIPRVVAELEAYRLAAEKLAAEKLADILAEVRVCAAHFVDMADARVDGTGDFDAYHSARHDLVMALDRDLSHRAPSDANDGPAKRALGAASGAAT